MSDRTAARLAWVMASVAIFFTVASTVLLLVNRLPVLESFRPHLIVVGTVYAVAGALIAARTPRNAVGWVLIIGSLFWTASFTASQYAWFAGITHPGTLPFAPFAAWVQSWIWQPGTVLLLTYLALLFPDGHFRSKRWRTFGIAVAACLVLGVVGQGGSAWHLRANIYLIVEGNVDFTTLGGFFAGLTNFGVVIMLAPLVAAVGSITRFRAARGDERQQLKWFAFAFAIAAVSIVVDQFVPAHIQGLPSLVGIIVLPIAVAVAVLKYRLYDLDIVIRKTVVFAVVTFALVAMYLAVLAVATLGQVSRLAVGAILLVVTFGPVRKAARTVADRVVYGKRATSYEVMSEFSERMSETYATEDVLPRMATILKNATGAATAIVWLRVGNELHAAAGDLAEKRVFPLVDGGLPEIPGADVTEVRDRGELLGALSVSMPANDHLDPARERLVRDLASQAGLMLRNVRLIEELKASRQRLVAAQDGERRKIERNIHDGAQQQLVALAVKLKLLGQLTERDPTKAAEMAQQLQGEATDALDNLRDLARGIYPPLLADKGLVAALESQVRKAVVPVTVRADGIGRFGQDTEAAVYFCCLEALQNIAKYANATAASITLGNGGGTLTFEVTDDGSGFDAQRTGYGTGLQGMADRLSALGGELEVRSMPGSGTTVAGSLPIGAVTT